MAGETKITVKMNSASQILSRFGLGADNSFALKLANEVARTTDPYVPMQTGMLKNTREIVGKSGGAELRYIMPYAKRQYYSGRAPGQSKAGPLRGRMWFERSKADHKGWKKESAAITGGKVK